MSARTSLPIPAGLEKIVMQLLEKDPANRVASAHELGRRLRALPDVAGWSPEQAEKWWKIHLPDLAAFKIVAEDNSTETADAKRPAGEHTTRTVARLAPPFGVGIVE
jgi:hypothetical protein